MIDWHSHILPRIDDGSKSVEESVSMLRSLASQGIKTVIATPHFYADDCSVERFLERRERSFEKLKSQLTEDMPGIRLGAEVRYYQGISRLEMLKDLRIEKTKLLLLEMPMCVWTESMIRELTELSGKGGVQIVLAHIDRYIKLQKQSVWKRLLENGILMQTNASFFTSFSAKRKAISMMGDGYIHFIGSDCHNMTTRPPMIGKAFENIRKKLGEDFIYQMNEYGYSMLENINY